MATIIINLDGKAIEAVEEALDSHNEAEFNDQVADLLHYLPNLQRGDCLKIEYREKVRED